MTVCTVTCYRPASQSGSKGFPDRNTMVFIQTATKIATEDTKGKVPTRRHISITMEIVLKILSWSDHTQIKAIKQIKFDKLCMTVPDSSVLTLISSLMRKTE